MPTSSKRSSSPEFHSVNQNVSFWLIFKLIFCFYQDFFSPCYFLLKLCRSVNGKLRFEKVRRKLKKDMHLNMKPLNNQNFFFSEAPTSSVLKSIAVVAEWMLFSVKRAIFRCTSFLRTTFLHYASVFCLSCQVHTVSLTVCVVSVHWTNIDDFTNGGFSRTCCFSVLSYSTSHFPCDVSSCIGSRRAGCNGNGS